MKAGCVLLHTIGPSHSASTLTEEKNPAFFPPATICFLLVEPLLLEVEVGILQVKAECV